MKSYYSTLLNTNGRKEHVFHYHDPSESPAVLLRNWRGVRCQEPVVPVIPVQMPLPLPLP